MQNHIPTISATAYDALRGRGLAPRLIDVRTPAEFEAGHVPGAALRPLMTFDADAVIGSLGGEGLGRDTPVYLTCKGGIRAAQAARRLQDAGYPNVVLLDGGTDAWVQAGLPVAGTPRGLSLEQQVQVQIGTLLVLKVVFGFALHPVFFAAAGLVGVGLVVAGLTRSCAVAALLARMPWNRAPQPEGHARA
jgi:rhodanese-related sulfurtransferase